MMSFQYLAKPNLCVSPHNACCIFLAKGKAGMCPEQEAENTTINKGISRAGKAKRLQPKKCRKMQKNAVEWRLKVSKQL
jgi:hypothetical protein